ncbi:MAG: ParB/RepB/Spo0J family partition protein, partial [Clostridia bacterium]|nr:ParB/RepB/Spo0J family partition protein [Clostridia bacterium]
MVRRGLGRGLEALIPQEVELREQIVALELEKIEPNPRQPRRQVDEAGLEELAASIREHGVVQPIVVCQVGEGRYRLVAGERRWRACRLLGMTTIPAVVKELSDRESTEVALVENLQREDLNPLEEATAYQMLQEEFGLTQEEVARRVGKSRAQVANTLRLLQLPAEVQGYIEAGLLSAGHGRALLALAGEEQQVRLAQEIVRKGLSVREAEKAVRREGRRRREMEARDAGEGEWAEIAAALAERLGTKVRVRGREGRGRIEVEFYSLDD